MASRLTTVVTMPKRPEAMPRDAFARFSAVPTRWADADVYGHVNNAIHYQLFDTAVNGPLVEAGLLDPTRSDTVFLVVDSGCSYFNELRFPQVIDAGVAVSSLGSSSVTYRVGLFVEGATRAAAQGHFVHVNVDRISRAPRPIGGELRDYLNTLVLPHPTD